MAKCGDAACATAPTITTVDTGGDVGRYTSIAIGIDGLPVVSYLDYTNGNLNVAKCGNPACSAGTAIVTVDSTGVVGEYSSIATGADGLPVIAYYDQTNGDLKVAKCADAACSTSSSATVDTGGTANVGQYTSITIGADGLPVIAYYDLTNADLKMAKCGNPACSAGNAVTTVDTGGTANVGQYTSITIGADGLPVIAYYDLTNGDLKVAKCANSFCRPYFRRR